MSTFKESKAPIQSTAGAIPVKNEKGQVSMQKVKVSRYVTGKRPEYAPQDSSDDDDEDFIKRRQEKLLEEEQSQIEENEPINAALDRRLQRLQQTRIKDDDDDDKEEEDDRYTRHQRRVHEPEVLGQNSDDERRGSESEEDEEDVDEEEIERRRALLRLRTHQQRQEEEAMELTAEKEGSSEEEESEYEEYTDSEEDDDGPRLKPVFVRKKDRITIQEKQRQILKERELELEAKRMADERKQQARRLVEQAAKQQLEPDKDGKDDIDIVNTDDENDEEEYEGWKIRELRRMKRDKEEREALEKEKQDVERFRNMTEDERKIEFKNNPRKVTNQQAKGKYKFLQKYYHRGAFFLDEEENALKRDFAAPTLEDHFDKTILPKVMQVKNFGRSGRTKYTHLVDQDSTQYDSPWTAESSQNVKFQASKGGGMKQTFEKPKSRKK